MDIQLLEPFDQYSSLVPSTTQGSMASRWNILTSGSLSLTTGINGSGQALKFGTSATSADCRYTFATAANQLSMSFGFKVNTLTAAWDQECIQLLSPASNHQWGLKLNAAGKFQLLGEGDSVLAISDTVFIPGAAHRLNITADLAASTFNLWVDGDADAGLTLTGVDILDDDTFGNATHALLKLRNNNGNDCDWTIDDIIVGVNALNNWGPMELNLLAPTSDVVHEFTPSTGVNNFANVDDATFNIETDYNSSDTLGQKDIFGFAAPSGVPEKILTVGLLNIARKEESAIRRMEEILRVGGVDYMSVEHSLIETYGHYVPDWQLNPTTGVAWTPTDISTLLGGYTYSSNT